MSDLPEFMSYLCSSRDELEMSKEWASELDDELSKRDALQYRVDFMKERMPETAALLADGGWIDCELRRELEALAAIKAHRESQMKANNV